MRYALIDAAGVVVNVILLDDVESYPVPPGHQIRKTDAAGPGWTWAGAQFVAPPPPSSPPAPPPPSQLKLWAGACLTIEAGDISNVPVGGNIAGAARFDVGYFWIFFAQTMPDTAYMALAYDDAGCRANVQKATDCLIVTMLDAAGNPVDPPVLNIEIKRAA